MADKKTEIKLAIIEQFAAGKQPNDLYSLYPDIPQGTIRTWFHRYEKSQRSTERAEVSEKRAIPERSLLQLVPPPVESAAVQVVFDAQTESDLLFIRRRLRQLANGQDVPPSVQVQASMGLLKMIELRTMGRIKETIEPERMEEDLSQLSDAELKERYQQLLMYDGTAT